jgi:hypothetical protein
MIIKIINTNVDIKIKLLQMLRDEIQNKIYKKILRIKFYIINK